MSPGLVLVLALLTGATGNPAGTIRPEAESADVTAHPNSVPEMMEQTETFGQSEMISKEKDGIWRVKLHKVGYTGRRRNKRKQRCLFKKGGRPNRAPCQRKWEVADSFHLTSNRQHFIDRLLLCVFLSGDKVSPRQNPPPEGQSPSGTDPAVDEEAEEDVMATGELNPNHYPARRAAKVVQHYLNTRYGSPFRLFGLQNVYSGNAEDVADSGRKYHLDILMQEMISNATEKCSAEVLFARGEQQSTPQVQASCDELLQINTKAQEEAFYQQHKMSQSLLSAQSLPDSFGHIEPDMKPVWHLGTVASSVVMLNQSTENTLYNMAQVANITQLATENDQLKFDCHVLLHEMVSQEILHWKLLFTWSPPEGVKVLQMEQLPHCHDCEKLPNTD